MKLNARMITILAGLLAFAAGALVMQGLRGSRTTPAPPVAAGGALKSSLPILATLPDFVLENERGE